MQLSDSATSIQKLTKPQIAALKKLGLFTVRDLLFYFPFRYIDFSQTKQIKDLIQGENVTLKATVKSIGSRYSFRGRLSLAEAIVSDETGSIKIVWFNQPYLAKTLKPGDQLFIAGSPEHYKTAFQFTNPIYEKVSDYPLHTARLVPIYRLKANLYPKTLRNLIGLALAVVSEIEESLPKEIVENQHLMGLAQTIQNIHFPKKLEGVERAKKRLAFEEIFLNQLLVQKHKMELFRKKAFAVPFNQSLVKNFVAELPYQLTPEQKHAAWTVLQNLEKPVPMNRLLEGDVGSGKTVVALIAGLQAAFAGYQVVFLVPTEILAQQHYATANVLFKNKKIKVCLLTNRYAKVGKQGTTKQHLQKLIAEGMPGVYFGTQALLGEKVTFKSLALVIIDEQHRFGVEQRSSLLGRKTNIPHLLSLTATPIPRTLQLAFYGELSISQIKSKPKGRKPIIGKLVSASDRTKAYQFVGAQIAAGRQAFVVTPLIEGDEASEKKAAKIEQETLTKIFPAFNIGLLHGKMTSTEKEKTMADFLANKIHILVTTSVVEVGVDVSNASVMLIEGAENFGLAQLHQFRGRVGRADYQSYCLLFCETRNPESIQRLEDFIKIQDGFALAELDLQQRGFGRLYGTLQGGRDFKYWDSSYISLVEPAKHEALKLLNKDIGLGNYPQLAGQLEGKVIHFE